MVNTFNFIRNILFQMNRDFVDGAQQMQLTFFNFTRYFGKLNPLLENILGCIPECASSPMILTLHLTTIIIKAATMQHLTYNSFQQEGSSATWRNWQNHELEIILLVRICIQYVYQCSGSYSSLIIHIGRVFFQQIFEVKPQH